MESNAADIRFSPTGLTLHFDDDDRSAVTKNFGAAPFDFGRIIADAHDGIGADLGGMGHHGVIGLLARLLTHFGVSADTPANDVFETANNPLHNCGRAHDNAADDPFVFRNAIAVEGE